MQACGDLTSREALPDNLPASHRRCAFFQSDDAFFVKVQLGFNPVETLDDLLEAAAYVGFQIVEPLVPGPLCNPYCGDECNHDR